MGAKEDISGDGAHASSSQEVLKVKENTKLNSTVNYASVSPHIKDVQLKGDLIKKKVQFQFWCGNCTFWGRAGDLCGFWRKSDSVTLHSPSPVGELAMLIAGVRGWGLHMASKSGVKPLLSRLSPELPNTTLLCPWYLRHSHEDFMLTSPQKTSVSCFSSVLAFWTFCVEGCYKLNEGRRQKMCKAMMAQNHWKRK